MSSYFSEPSPGLDPALFDGDDLKDSVRTGLLNVLYSGLENELHFEQPWSWTRAWLAGSGVSYQWGADRGPHDLDVLFGIDYPEFLYKNPEFPHLPESEAASFVNQRLKDRLWPKTGHYSIGGQGTYEVTFYWNPGTGTDIRNIHPYAAYDLTNDEWAVRPPVLPKDPRSLYPDNWVRATENDASLTRGLAASYNADGALGRQRAYKSGRALWEEIHGGRHQAFSDTGAGYGDFHNYRWQRAKETGVADILRGIVREADASDELASLPSPSDILTRAALRYASPGYLS